LEAELNFSIIVIMQTETSKTVQNRPIPVNLDSNLTKPTGNDGRKRVGGQVQFPKRHQGNSRSPEGSITLLSNRTTSPQQANQLGVNKRLNQTKHNMTVRAGALTAKGTNRSATQVSPNTVAYRGTGHPVQTSRPSHSTQHMNLSMVFGFASLQLSPKILKFSKALSQGVVGVLTRDTEVPS
jgi:hypothetical protein